MVHDGGRDRLTRSPGGGARRRARLAALLVAAVAPGLAAGCATGRNAGTTVQAVAAGATPAVEAVPAAAAVGFYTEAQSRRGEAIFLATCARCHRPEMTGSEIVPPLTGPVFMARWSRRTAADLFEKVRSMPPVPIPVPPTTDEYADALAYILSRNAFPPGSRELTADFDALQAIPMAGGGGSTAGSR